MKEILPGDTGETAPLDDNVMYDPAEHSLVVAHRWSPRWFLIKLRRLWLHLHAEWFALAYVWYGFQAGIEHGRESPGCLSAPHEGPRFALRQSAHIGESMYCNVCLRPIGRRR